MIGRIIVLCYVVFIQAAHEKIKGDCTVKFDLIIEILKKSKFSLKENLPNLRKYPKNYLKVKMFSK